MALTQVQQGMLVDGILTADTAGRLKMADGFVNDAKISGVAASKISGQLADANMSSGSLIQVVQVVKNDTYVTTSGTFGLVTGLAASITPLSTSSKILVHAMVNGGANHSVNAGGAFRLYRDGSVVSGSNGNAAGSRTTAWAQSSVGVSNPWSVFTHNLMYLDSPATASSTTYQIYARAEHATGTFVNYAYDDSDNSDRVRLISTITLMEILA